MEVSAHAFREVDPITHDSSRNERGAAAVEFALVLPVLLLLIFGTIDFARLVTTYTTVRSAAREAVRYGSAVGDDQYLDCSGIEQAAIDTSEVPQLTSAEINVRYVAADSDASAGACGSPPGGTPGSFRLEVSVSHPFNAITPFIDQFIDGQNVKSTSRRTIQTWE